MSEFEPLLSLRLSVDYRTRPGALRDVQLEMRRGEILGLVGQSGSGKSTLALAILRLLNPMAGRVNGEVWFSGRDLLQLGEKEMARIRGREIALVLQSPLASLNPSLRIRTQLMEAWRAHRNGSGENAPAHILNLLESVCLPPEESFLALYPRQLSVGLAQRVLLAMAIMHRPSLLIADEPTSALDGITASEILKLMERLNKGLKTAILYISHDLLSVASLCHRVAILLEGKLVECAETRQIFQNPSHPYTRQLIEALPRHPF